jgi:hypothetical protein
VAGSGIGIRLPIGVAAPPILAIEARRIAANIAKLSDLLQQTEARF